MSGLHQFTAVSVKGRGLLIEGAPGSGKSSLALALIDRGAMLVGDDGVSLAALNGRLLAGPAPATEGLLEVRNVGLVPMPYVDSAAIALVIALDPEAPRFIEAAEERDVLGLRLPLVRLWPGNAVLALRAELALERYGIG
ncbi:HPr kinase/phosphatase C-terminal domain-containing protein [Novosphingobium aquae]|uniref:HPr kinase/phosphatase C-terminal domain-containing protein n=1 Tax=Novosphingobium aquae TaxID=3133435 RepID=A0ABU8S3I8_9SPHN